MELELSALNSFIWGWPMILLILGTGVWLTVRTGALQLRRFGEILRTTVFSGLFRRGERHHTGADSSLSPFQAFATAISGSIGTGNIIGVVAAILTGGPGAVFWMWLSAFFGMATSYAENVLGLYYRCKNGRCNYIGGAFYYILNGLGSRTLSFCAAAFCALAAVGMSGVQTNKIAGTLAQAAARISGYADLSFLKVLISLLTAVLAAVIIFGGIRRIGSLRGIFSSARSRIYTVRDCSCTCRT